MHPRIACLTMVILLAGCSSPPTQTPDAGPPDPEPTETPIEKTLVGQPEQAPQELPLLVRVPAGRAVAVEFPFNFTIPTDRMALDIDDAQKFALHRVGTSQDPWSAWMFVESGIHSQPVAGVVSVALEHRWSELGTPVLSDWAALAPRQAGYLAVGMLRTPVALTDTPILHDIDPKAEKATLVLASQGDASFLVQPVQQTEDDVLLHHHGAGPTAYWRIRADGIEGLEEAPRNVTTPSVIAETAWAAEPFLFFEADALSARAELRTVGIGFDDAPVGTAGPAARDLTIRPAIRERGWSIVAGRYGFVGGGGVLEVEADGAGLAIDARYFIGEAVTGAVSDGMGQGISALAYTTTGAGAGRGTGTWHEQVAGVVGDRLLIGATAPALEPLLSTAPAATSHWRTSTLQEPPA